MWLDNVDLTFDEEALKAIAKNASEKKTGARALRGVIDKVVADLMFENGGFHEKKKKILIKNSDILKYF